MQKIYLVCGVPGSGKTWVCNQLKDKFDYINHDNYKKNYALILKSAASYSKKPILADCPFAERALRDELVKSGYKVIPVFIIEDPSVSKQRYETRDKKPYPQSFLTRAKTIENRAKEWDAFAGTSKQVLEHLKNI
jgi:dephospho-CoA kinase